MKKQAFFTRTAALLILFSMLVGIMVPLSASAASKKDFEITVDYGYGNVCRRDKHCPFRITVKNNGGDFEGSVELVLNDPNSRLVAHDKSISLTSGATKTVNMVCLVADHMNSYFQVRILDNHNKVVRSESFVLKVADPDTTVSVGVLTDDFNAMSYLSGKSLIGAPNFSTRLFKLDASEMSEDFLALEMLDVIVVSNFSTDSLSDLQLSALMNWVSNGGLLMVGTGDSASKTLSGLNDYLSVKTGELRSANTTFGSAGLSFTYNYTVDSSATNYYYVYDQRVQYVMKQLDLASYLSEYEGDPAGLEAAIEYDMRNSSLFSDNAKIYPICVKIYEENSDLLLTLWDLYNGESYNSYLAWHNTDEIDQAKQWFEEFCEESVIFEMIKYYAENLLIMTPTVSTGLGPVVSKVLDLSYGDVLIPGDDIDSDKGYAFASYARIGSGYAAVFAVDLTKTPFVNSSYNYKLLTHVIESLLGETISERSYSYWGRRSGNWVVRELTERLSSASLIPVAAYIIILFGYTIAAFVIYFRLRKKNKTSKLWGTQAVLAVSAALLIFLLSFTTRITFPRVSSATIVTDLSGKVSSKTYASVLLPKVKKYNINFSGDLVPALSYSDSSSNYYSSGPLNDNEEIFTAFRDKPGVSAVTINSPATMSNVSFELTEKKYAASSGIELVADYSDGALSGHVTNNTGETLENAFIAVNYGIFPIKSILPGETVDLSTIKGYSFIDVKRSSGSSIFARSGDDQIFDYDISAASALLGINNTKFKKEYNKRAAFNYVVDQYLSGYTGLGGAMFFESYIFTAKGGEYYKKVNPVQATTEDALATLGLNAEGLPVVSKIPPCFVAFAKKTESVLEKPGRHEENVKIYMVIPEWEYYDPNLYSLTYTE